MARFIITALFFFNLVLTSASWAGVKVPSQICEENKIHKMQSCRLMASGPELFKCRDHVKREHNLCIEG
jgi:hypothetical protein